MKANGVRFAVYFSHSTKWFLLKYEYHSIERVFNIKLTLSQYCVCTQSFIDNVMICFNVAYIFKRNSDKIFSFLDNNTS